MPSCTSVKEVSQRTGIKLLSLRTALRLLSWSFVDRVVRREVGTAWRLLSSRPCLDGLLACFTVICRSVDTYASLSIGRFLLLDTAGMACLLRSRSFVVLYPLGTVRMACRLLSWLSVKLGWDGRGLSSRLRIFSQSSMWHSWMSRAVLDCANFIRFDDRSSVAFAWPACELHGTS